MRQFEIFISYAHADTEPRPGFNVSRLGRLIEELSYELGCRSKRSRFKILRDVEMTNVSDNFREKVHEAIAACDLAILFLSENFCRSEECEDEVARLIKAGKPIVPIETEPPMFDEDQDRIKKYRAAVKDIIYPRFWGIGNDQKPAPFGYPLPDISPTRDKYYEVLADLVTGLKTRAAALTDAADEQAEDSQRRDAVFLACPTMDVNPEALRLASTLELKGHSVRAFDIALDVRTGHSFNEVLSNALAKCDVYVQLLGATPGKSVPGTNLLLVRAQYEMAKRAGLPIYIWRRPDFDMEEVDPDYRSFLKEIAQTCQISSFIEFQEYLGKKLDDIAELRRSKERRVLRSQGPDVAKASPFVAIDAAPADRDLARKIAEALAKHANVDHLDYDLNGQKLAEAVTDNDALVLAYGTSPEGQKRTRAHFKLIKRPKPEFDFKGLELAIGNGAPSTAEPCPSGPNVHVIPVTEEVDRDAVSAFLRQLGVGPAGGEAR